MWCYPLHHPQHLVQSLKKYAHSLSAFPMHAECRKFTKQGAREIVKKDASAPQLFKSCFTSGFLYVLVYK